MCNKQNNDKKYVFVCVCMYVRVYDMRKYIHNIQIFVLIFLISEFSVVCLFDSLGWSVEVSEQKQIDNHNDLFPQNRV